MLTCRQLRPLVLTLLCLLLDGDCRQVQQKEANRVLNGLASTKRSQNPASIATRKPEFPLAACDITRTLLRRGDWYHRRGKASDLCTKEWSKLPPELQAEYVKVQTLDDLGDQVSLYVPQSDINFVNAKPPGQVMDKTQKVLTSSRDDNNYAGAHLYRLWQQLVPTVNLSSHPHLGLLLALVIATVLLIAPRAWRGRKSISLAAELLAEEDLAKRSSQKHANNRKSTDNSSQASATKERKVQRNRSRKERRRLVDGLESKDSHVELDDDSGSTQSSQSDSGAGSSLQLLEDETAWIPATSSRRAKKPIQRTTQEDNLRGEQSKRPTKSTKASTVPNTHSSSSSKSRPRSNQKDSKVTPRDARAAKSPQKTVADQPGSKERKQRERATSLGGGKLQATRPAARTSSDNKRSSKSSRVCPPRRTGQSARSGQPRQKTVAAVNAWAQPPKTPAVTTEPDNPMPALPSLNFQGMTEAASTKRMLSPAFASHMPTNATNAPGQVGISTQGAPLSVPSSPGILFGSFDQWEGARTGTASAGVADAPAVDAPEDVSLVAVEKVVCNGKAYLVDRTNSVVYDFEDGVNEVGDWDESAKTISLYDDA